MLSKPKQANIYQDKSARNYALWMLTLVYSFNFLDRQLLSILQEPIKKELLLSDGQLGLLTGFAFALFYVIAGIPIAKMADSGNRRNIITWSLSIWSFMTAVCGLAINFSQLFFARIGVGIGEAGCSPPSHSMISDMFPPKQRATGLAIYSTGIYVGILLGFLLGGWINQFFGWRLAFMVVGLPGIILAIILKKTVQEPTKGVHDLTTLNKGNTTFKQCFSYLIRIPTIRLILIGSALSGMAGYAISIWSASYMIRTFHMETGEVGTWLALVIGIVGGIATLGSGKFADKMAWKSVRWYAWIPALASVLMVPAVIFSLLSDSFPIYLLLTAISVFFSNIFLSIGIAVLHNIVDVKMRAMTSAILFLILNLFGLGLGPLLIGYLSDLLIPFVNTASLKYAMLLVIPLASLIAGLMYHKSSQHIVNDMRY